ncbi:hypothetical protein HQ489_01790 [Candidatus Woesearchaeota archaeon]|nr:hypothetical protein [Candidatus Woesearchaeota archaeon]
MGYATKLVFYIIPLILLIVVVFIFFGQGGAWEDLKDVISDAKTVAPDLTFGENTLNASEIITPAHHAVKIKELVKIINETMLKKGNDNCFVKGPVFDDFRDGDERTSISFVRVSNTESKLVVRSGAGGKQIDTTLQDKFENLVPCVIGGSKEITTNFVARFFDKTSSNPGNYFMPVGAVTLSYKFGATTSDGNGISVADFPEEKNPINDEGDNMENNGWLFTPDGKNICFFPTNKAVNADDDGIDNDYFDNLQGVKICS